MEERQKELEQFIKRATDKQLKEYKKMIAQKYASMRFVECIERETK